MRNCSSTCSIETVPAPERVEHLPHEFGFAFAHQTGIHVDAAHAFGAQRPQAEREGHRRIHAAADEEENVAVAHRAPDVLFDQRNAMARVPVLLAAADVEQEIRQNAVAFGGVHHFGMKLHGVESAPRRRHGGDRAGGGLAQRAKIPAARPPPDRKWLIQTCWRSGSPENSAVFGPPFSSSVARPYSPFSPFWTTPPSRCAINCWP